MLSKRLTACFGGALCALLLLCFSAAFQAQAYEAITAEIPVTCDKIEDLDGEHDYELSILEDDGLTPKPDNDHLTVKAGGSGAFTISIAEPGTYKYTVKELDTGDEDVKLDNRIYDITVFVTNTEEDGLMCIVAATVAGTDEKPDHIRFSNGAAEGRKRDTGEDSSEAAPPQDTSSPDNGNAITGSGGITAFALFSALILLIVFMKRSDREKTQEEEQ